MADKIFLLKKAVAAKGFDIPDISATFTQTDYINRAQELFGMDAAPADPLPLGYL
ncbi:MAG: hypothetical protein MZV63_68385 [Marinilabiliales bacterium]|nr:hypothetical protein [Marinilabiliales bacterium]